MQLYATYAACEIEVIATTGVLYSTAFDVEPHPSCDFDALAIGEQKFCGTAGPDDVAVPVAGAMVTWSSDTTAAARGWTVCWGPNLPPTISPSSSAPTAIEMAGSTCRRHSDCAMGDSLARGLGYCRMALDGPQPQPQHCYGCGHCVNVVRGADVFDRNGACPNWCRDWFDDQRIALQLDSASLTALPEGTFRGLSVLRLLTLENNRLVVLEAGAFRGVERELDSLTLKRNALTVLPDGLFLNLSRLRQLNLDRNRLTVLQAGLFSGLRSLQQLWLSENSVTGLPEGLFNGLGSLYDLNLRGNHLTMLPNGVFNTTGSLAELWLDDNDLTALQPDMFSGTPTLRLLRLNGNDLTVLPAGVFSGLAGLEVLLLDGNKLTLLQGGVFSGLDGLNILQLHANKIASGAAASLEPVWAQLDPVRFLYNPNPLRCHNTSAGTLVCDGCSQGYLAVPAVGSTACRQPERFGLNEAAATAVTAAAARGLPTYLTEKRGFAASFLDVLLADRRASFVGFTGDPNKIGFELSFGPQLSIGCGRTATGNTAEAGSATGFRTAYVKRWFKQFHASPEHNLEFTVAREGTFTFDSCESRSATALFVYSRANASEVLEAVQQAVPSFENIPQGSDLFYVTDLRLPSSVLQPPDSDRCPVGIGYAWTLNISEPGDYVLVVTGEPERFATDRLAGTSADYEVRMTCHGDADTVAASPGGIAIEPTTGRIAGSPENPGTAYAARLNAVDSERNTATLFSWTFDVRANPPFSLATNATSASSCLRELVGLRERSVDRNMDEGGLGTTVLIDGFRDVSKTATEWTIGSSGCSVAELFTGYAVDSTNQLPLVSFQVRIEDADTGNATDLGTGLDSLVSLETGRMSLTARGAGRHRVVLQATTQRDDQAPIDVSEFLFHVRTGPNMADCGASGRPIDPAPIVDPATGSFNNTFRCACDNGWSGANCGTAPALSASASADSGDTATVGASLGAVLALMLVALIAFRIQLYRLKNRPIDVSEMQQDVMASLGLAATKDIGKSEVGISLVLDRTAIDASLELPGRFKAELVTMLSRAVPQIKRALEGAKICSPGHNHTTKRVLVVLQKGDLKGAGSIDHAVEDLARKAGKGKLSVLEFNVIEANVAVPQHVPREVARAALTRLQPLGAGAFGVVFQYQLKERGAMMPVFIAAKSIKAGVDGSAEARKALLREAALGALLQHRNVVSTVGICTAPRDVPALLLLAFCSEGSLEAHCEEATADSMSVPERLTYCAQVLQGLQYISTRRIVHRDVAARNVLLDSTMVCKVSDFGMATALAEDGKEYIRSNEQLALRWCAIEVIKEGKYSVQSDVWAFGVLAFEVFACGTLPYADQFDNLTEISEFVKQGGKLGRPNAEACPVEVYEQLMLPCFAADAADRPTFGGLYGVAVMHGAEEDDEAMAERASKRQHRLAANREAAAGDRALLGPSVHHLAVVLVPMVQEAVREIKKVKGHPNQVSFDDLDPVEASIWHTVHAFAKPASESTVCPRDGEMGCAYVDTLVEEDDVGHADGLLSYSWGYQVAEVSAALSAWTERGGRDPKKTRIWICSLCLNQHRLGGGDAATPEDLAKEFGDRVVALGRILPMLEPWHDPSCGR